MRIFRRVATFVAALSVLLLSAVIAGSTAGASDPQLLATGSSFAGVAISQWQGQFNELDGGNVAFTESSSTVGLDDFCNQTVDFAASDLSYAAGASDCSPAQVSFPYQYIPAVGGSLAFEYNLQGTDGQRIRNLVLSAPVLAAIFTGAIKRWDDAEIQLLNPATPLPDEAITPYYRSDPSGENYLLSSYLLATDPGPITSFQQEATVPAPGTPSAYWALFSNGIPSGLDLDGVSGSNAAAQGPQQTSGGISYVETADAKGVGLPVASVVNAAGNAVQPSAENGIEALSGATLNADLTENLGGVFTSTASDAYPLSSYSYFVAPCSPSLAAAEQPPTTCSGGSGTSTFPAAQGAELGQFLDYAVCSGQGQMASLGDDPLSENLVDAAFVAIGRINGATEPVSPTAANCPNPTLTGGIGSISAVGPLISQTSNGLSTLSVSPPVVGNAWVLAIRVSNASIRVASVTGGGAGNGWTKLTQASDSSQKRDIEEWLGPIFKSKPSVITVSYAGVVSATPVQLNAQEFSSGTGASTVWSADVAAGSTNDAESTTISYPSLSPASSGELYVGFSRTRSNASVGDTPGFTYDLTNANCLFIYDPDVSSSISPTASQKGGSSVTTGALIEAG